MKLEPPEEPELPVVLLADRPDHEDDLADADSDVADTSSCSHEVHEKRFFSEPLYCQRYQFVLDLLAQDRWKRHLRRLVDVGANNCGFLFRLRNSCGMRYMREVIALDIDEDELNFGAQKTVGLLTASLFKDQRRPFYACDVYHMAGSVTDTDRRLKDVDAVVAIEMIEHMEPPELAKFPASVFGHMRPKIAVITTPNSEFNVLFPHFAGPFRHWDHKFEFTRQEFQDWANAIIDEYPEYKVEFDGVGFAPHDDSRRNLGPCTQIAVFYRKDFEEAANNGDFAHREEASRLYPTSALVSDDPDPSSQPYKIVVHNHHPRLLDLRTPDERVFDAVYDEILKSYDMIKRLSEDDESSAARVHMSDLTYAIETRCYDDYGDPYHHSPEQIRDIMMERGKGLISGTDDGGNIYFTVDESYFDAPPSDDEDYDQFEIHDDVYELIHGPDDSGEQNEDWDY